MVVLPRRSGCPDWLCCWYGISSCGKSVVVTPMDVAVVVAIVYPSVCVIFL